MYIVSGTRQVLLISSTRLQVITPTYVIRRNRPSGRLDEKAFIDTVMSMTSNMHTITALLKKRAGLSAIR